MAGGRIKAKGTGGGKDVTENNEITTRVMELRRRFDELKDKLNYLRGEWIEAHDRRDLDRETELINRETELFGQVNDVITEFSHLMRHYGTKG